MIINGTSCHEVYYHMINQWTQTCIRKMNEYASPVDLFLSTTINPAYLNLHDCTAAKWDLIEQ